MHTDSYFTQSVPNYDLNIFLGADQFQDFAGVATLPAAPAAGLPYRIVPTTAAAKFFLTPDVLMRAGQLAIAALAQNQFGTAAGVPGPSAVAGTSGPSALPASLPTPIGSKLATVAGPVTGLSKKGIQINSIDVIYQVLAVAASAATVGVTSTAYGDAVAPVVTNLLALANNGLPLPVAAQPRKINIPMTAPAFIIPTVPTALVVNLNLTAGSGGTIQFIGINLECSYNLN